MPPPTQGARSISSYFKPAAGTIAKATSAVTSSPTSAASGSGTAAAPAVTPTKRSGLSENAKRAIAEAAALSSEPGAGAGAGEDEHTPKKARIDSSPASATKTASIFSIKSPSTTTSKTPTARSKTREELRERLSANPKWASELDLELESMGEDWLLALQDELTKPYFLSLKDFVTTEQRSKKVFPPAQDIYSWSRFCPLKDIRVVIIGQDPYHDDGQAHGLAFSVRKGVRIPPSLRNIYKEMHEEYPDFAIPKHGDLTEWAKHGVLLLNTSLTVRAHEAGSHANRGWDQFTAAVLKVVTSRLAPGAGASTSVNPFNLAAAAKPSEDKEGEEKDTVKQGGDSKANAESTEGEAEKSSFAGGNGVVFMAWGAHAAKMCAGVDQKKHLILKSAHPSPLSASRGFFGNNHFKKANEWLHQRYGPGGGVDWKSLGQEGA